MATYGGISLNAEQLKNAQLIAATGRKMGASKRDIQIAIMTAMTESNLRNLNYGDRDSVGLFQQRAGWGSASQRMDPTYAATSFYKTLFKVKNRNSMQPWQAAQAVQRSAFSDGSNYKSYWALGQQVPARATTAPGPSTQAQTPEAVSWPHRSALRSWQSPTGSPGHSSSPQ
jgi:hypothetical protein